METVSASRTLVVYNEDHGIVKAFRKVPGVETVNVRRLNLLQLAPGGHLGRFVIWTQGAFALLDEVYGTFDKASALKKDYFLPTAKITNPDVTRISELFPYFFISFLLSFFPSSFFLL